MENTKIEKPAELKIAPVQDQSLRFIWKNRNQHIDPECTEPKYCLLEDGLIASRMSQCYYLNVLTAKHSDVIRLLVNSKSVRADEELSQLIAATPELTSFELSSGNPGMHYLDQKMLTGLEAYKIAPEIKVISLESSQDWNMLFRVMSTYSFYKVRKKKFSDEFSSIEAEMKLIVDRYRLPNRLSWNASVDKTGRPKKVKLDSTYLKKYPSQNA